jgi:hypothetical protein
MSSVLGAQAGVLSRLAGEEGHMCDLYIVKGRPVNVSLRRVSLVLNSELLAIPSTVICTLVSEFSIARVAGHIITSLL